MCDQYRENKDLVKSYRDINDVTRVINKDTFNLQETREFFNPVNNDKLINTNLFNM